MTEQVAKLESGETFALLLKIPQSAVPNLCHISVKRILRCQVLLF